MAAWVRRTSGPIVRAILDGYVPNDLLLSASAISFRVFLTGIQPDAIARHGG